MSNWSNNNIAHRNTWVTLLGLGELSRGFAESKDLKMKGLSFWSGVASGEMNDVRADALAAQMHNLCVVFWAAEYEDGYDQTASLRALSVVLRNAEADVPTLANVMDDAYQFVGEPSAEFSVDEIASVTTPTGGVE